MKELFVPQEHWDQGYQKLDLFVVPPNDPVRAWIERHFRGGSGTCLELGCFPGRFLAVFGQLGYEVHGVDLTPRIETDLKPWLQNQGFRVGDFARADVFTHPFARRYDVVCSFGLIEHFRDWPGLLRRHAELVAPGGRLAVLTPNFRGWVQWLFHRTCDRRNLDGHNLEAMEPQAWAQIVRELGFETLACGYLGPFEIWAAEQPRNLLQKAAIKLMRKSVPLWRLLPDNVPAYAPYCVMIARNAQDASAA